MRFLEQVVAGAETRSLTSGTARPSGWLVDAFGSTRTASGERVSVQSAVSLSPVWSAVSLIAEKVGELPFKVYRDLDDDLRVEARTHRAWRICHDAPNAATPAFRFWSTAAAHLLLWGNAFVEKTRDPQTGFVDELWIVDPASVVVEWDGRRKRFYQDTTSGRKRWSDEEMLHITGFSLDGVVGDSPISRCRQSLGTAIAREKFEGSFYANGGSSRVALEHPLSLSEGAAERVRQRWQTVYGGAANAGGAVVLEEGLTARTLSMPMTDMEFVASQQMTRTDIATIFHLPPSYLGGSTGDSLTYATVESNKIQLVDMAISPVTNVIARSVSADKAIFPQSVFTPEFVLEGLMRGDHQSRADFYSKMFGLVDGEGRRALTIDEIRALENRSPAERAAQPPPEPDPPAGNGNGNGPFTNLGHMVAAIGAPR